MEIKDKIQAIKAIRTNQHIEFKDVTTSDGLTYKAVIMRSSLYEDKQLVEAIMAFGVKRHYEELEKKELTRIYHEE